MQSVNMSKWLYYSMMIHGFSCNLNPTTTFLTL